MLGYVATGFTPIELSETACEDQYFYNGNIVNLAVPGTLTTFSPLYKVEDRAFVTTE